MIGMKRSTWTGTRLFLAMLVLVLVLSWETGGSVALRSRLESGLVLNPLGDNSGVVTCFHTQLVDFNPRNADGDLGSSGFYELVGWEKTSPSEHDLSCVLENAIKVMDYIR